jgi:DNA-binding response OmpR family regulator
MRIARPEDPATSHSTTIIMSGLYTDRKYRTEALDYFKADDYVAKPLAVDDLIKLFKKHLPQDAAAASPRSTAAGPQRNLQPAVRVE